MVGVETLGYHESRVLLVLADVAQERGSLVGSEYLSQALGLDRGKVIRAMRRLEDRGAIERHGRNWVDGRLPRYGESLASLERVFPHTHKPRRPTRAVPKDAVREGRTRFPSTVRAPGDVMQVLKPGRNCSKLGDSVTRGRWRDGAIYSLALEERRTCPTSCRVYAECYGNNMHWAHRIDASDPADLMLHVELEVASLVVRHHPDLVVVRLHELGDFFSVDYVRFWGRLLDEHDALRVFGYTAWPEDTPVGRAVVDLRERRWDVFAVRTSGYGGSRAAYTERDAYRAGAAFWCPQQRGGPKDPPTCGACGACWATDRNVVFREH